MRRAKKFEESELKINNYKYIEGNSANNKKISNILYKEQKGFCAYTDEYLSRTDARDIEHFNPNIKGKEEDGYNNWFLVKHQWNNEKQNKWIEPILHPTDENFEEKIIYSEGDYLAKNPEDEAAKNLISLLKLDDPILASNRKKYISRVRNLIFISGGTPISFFKILIEEHLPHISYTRAIEEEFNIDLWSILP